MDKDSTVQQVFRREMTLTPIHCTGKSAGYFDFEQVSQTTAVRFEQTMCVN